MRRVQMAAAVILLAGCASTPAVAPTTQSVTLSTVAVASPTPDLPDTYTLKAGRPERGDIQDPRPVKVEREVVVYRLYDSRAASGMKGVAGRMGTYWTDFSTATEAEARDKLAVCKGWNNMAKLVRCKLPKGAVVVRGRGYDVNCALTAGSGSTAYHGGGAPQIAIGDPEHVLSECTDADTGW